MISSPKMFIHSLDAAEYIRSSPWTSSLSDEMQKLASTEPKRCGLGMVAALANMLHSKVTILPTVLRCR